MNNQRMLVGLFAGVAVGAALGVLFAPDKGTELRRRITSKGGNYTRNLKDKFGNLVNTASESVDSVKSKLSDMAGQGGDSQAANGQSTSGSSATQSRKSTGTAGATTV